MTRSSAPPPHDRSRRPARTAATAIGAGFLLALVAAPAYAHDELESSNPADGATLARPPASVVLTFAEPPVALGAQVVVTGPDGPVTSGTPRLDGDDVVADVLPSAPAGRYTVAWRVTSDDGHPVSGSLGFTAQAAAAGGAASGSASGATSSGSPGPAAPASAAATAVSTTPAASPAPAEVPRREPLIPSWAWIVAGVLVIGGAVRLNRRAKSEQKGH